MKQLTFVKLFQPRFKPMVRDGSKANTIRPTPKRMPRVGDRISLRCWSGKPYRSKQEIIGESTITSVETCAIDEHGSIIGGCWSNGEALAKMDGFSDFQEMLEWFRKEHKSDSFEGIFIAWTPLSAGAEQG